MVPKTQKKLGKFMLDELMSPSILFKGFKVFISRVSDPDPDWNRIQSGQWIRIRIRNPDPDPGGQK
jgi:hypothetical protein